MREADLALVGSREYWLFRPNDAGDTGGGAHLDPEADSRRAFPVAAPDSASVRRRNAAIAVRRAREFGAEVAGRGE